MLVPNFVFVAVVVLVFLIGFSLLGAAGELIAGRWKRRLFQLIVAVVGVGILVELWSIPTVHLVRESDGEVTHSKKHMLGSVDYTLANGRTLALARNGDERVLVVNDTKGHVLRVSQALYGYGSSGSSGLPFVVPPGEFRTMRPSVDLVGPDDPPPSSVKTKGGSASKVWLTWERSVPVELPEPEEPVVPPVVPEEQPK